MSDMATIELPYVQRFRDRHGRWRSYYRRPGFLRATLPDPAEPGFMAAYEAAGRDPLPARTEGAGAERTGPGSIAALIVAYYQTAEWSDLRESTKRGYRNLLDRFREKHGTKSARTVETRHLEAIFQGMAPTPGAARNLRKRLCRVFRLAVRLGWRVDNPVTASEAPKTKTRGFIPWSEADIAAFERRWPSGTRERRALYLLLYTLARRSDVVGLGRQHVRAGRMHFRQVKTGGLVAILIHAKLQAELDLAPAGDLAFILTEFGKPFTAAGFTAWFRERAEMAGLVGRTPHGLRKAAGRRLAEFGATTKEIAAALGHASLGEVERYTRDADQIILSDAAIDRLARDGA